MHISSTILLPKISIIWLGRLCYAEALATQHRYVEGIIQAKKEKKYENIRNTLLLVEHTPVYTVGIRDYCYSLDEEERLKKLGADFYRTDRGGLITFHGPGQLVAYPIFDLSSFSVRDPQKNSTRIGVRRFVHLIEETVIQTVRGFGLSDADRSVDTGVWLGQGSRKISAIGIHVRWGVTYHGLALNCSIDLNWFEHILPCGLTGKKVTSLSYELGREVAIDDVKQPLINQFGNVFQCDVSQIASSL